MLIFSGVIFQNCTLCQYLSSVCPVSFLHRIHQHLKWKLCETKFHLFQCHQNDSSSLVIFDQLHIELLCEKNKSHCSYHVVILLLPQLIQVLTLLKQPPSTTDAPNSSDSEGSEERRYCFFITQSARCSERICHFCPPIVAFPRMWDRQTLMFDGVTVILFLSSHVNTSHSLIFTSNS